MSQDINPLHRDRDDTELRRRWPDPEACLSKEVVDRAGPLAKSYLLNLLGQTQKGG